MVTSTKQPDKKVVTMSEHSTAAVVPQRTLLGEVNEHITCPLCRGYYIDATTIVECLHSFCRSCIIKHLQVKSYCPVCEMMINSAKPNIKLDKALQDIVYKLVPGLFQKEMERRQQFYASRPGPAATATPEQRGEDTERIIFSPEDVISFSLEYADVTDTDSISSKSSDSNEPQPTSVPRRYLQCPAVVNISHLKKFLSMKFDIDSTQFAIDILYKRVPLPDYYTLMDIAYIYTWKRNEPMRFFYQIIDYVAIRNRLFEINRKGPGFRDRKASFANTEDTSASSPAPQITDQASEASSGTDSPMPDDNLKQVIDSKKAERSQPSNDTDKKNEDAQSSSPKSKDEDVEKSQFLNSFELTAKSNCLPGKSPVKSTSDESITTPVVTPPKIEANTSKADEKPIEPPKRKFQAPPQAPELKKLKIELEKAKISHFMNNTSNVNQKKPTEIAKAKEPENAAKTTQPVAAVPNMNAPAALPPKEAKPQVAKQQDASALKRTGPGPQNIMSPKRKPPEAASGHSMHLPHGNTKPMSPMKSNVPKSEGQLPIMKPPEVPKPHVKKMPDLKPGIPMTQSSQNKGHPINKVRMDLLANNSDPTIDRSKILSQVKTSLSATTAGSQSSGDQLKSLFDSCKINIPSSLSITLTDQKLDPKNPGETSNQDNKKPMVNKNYAGVNNTAHKVPSPPVHNYIEILKLPDSDPKKMSKTEGNAEVKPNTPNKGDPAAPQLKQPVKSSESSAKGPVPNLKPISDTKLAKQQSGSFSVPITFQQTFEQQIQTLQTDKKTKVPKNKTQVPKLVPATPKSISAANKSINPINKPTTQSIPATDNKTGAALDLSTPHTAQNIGQQQTFYKAFETMQSIDNLAKKHNLPTKGLPASMSTSMHHNTVFPGRPMNTGISPLRIPSTSTMNQMKHDKSGPSSAQMNNSLQDMNKMNPSKTGNSSAMTSPAYQMGSHASPTAQPSPRQTRSPSSSPKLVIAEEKQMNPTVPEQNMNQSSQITSSQISSMKPNTSEHTKPSPVLSKPALKPLPPVSKLSSGIRQPITPSLKPNPAINFPTDYLMSQSRPQLMPHHPALLRQQMELFSRQFDIYKNMTNLAHQSQNDFNNKDKQ